MIMFVYKWLSLKPTWFWSTTLNWGHIWSWQKSGGVQSSPLPSDTRTRATSTYSSCSILTDSPKQVYRCSLSPAALTWLIMSHVKLTVNQVTQALPHYSASWKADRVKSVHLYILTHLRTLVSTDRWKHDIIDDCNHIKHKKRCSRSLVLKL